MSDLPLTRSLPFEEHPAPEAGILFPVSPEDVPEAAVRVVKRTLLRHPLPDDPMDDELARLLVAMVIAVLVDRAPEAAAVLVSEYTRETGAMVTIQACD